MNKDQPLEEILYSAFYDVFRASGAGMSVAQMDRLRESSKRFADILEARNRLYIIENLEKLQKRISEAFKVVEDRVAALEAKPKKKTPKKKSDDSGYSDSVDRQLQD